MSRERKLLQRALDALRDIDSELYESLEDDIRAELQKPEPVECGWLIIEDNVFNYGWKLDKIKDGKHWLHAVRIEDDQKI
jgi:hypothetical protein